MKTVKVVAAIICDDMKEKNKIFATARGYGDLKGGWESWLDIDMHRAEGENSFIDAMKSQLEDMAMEAMMDLSCLGYCLGL